MKEISSNSVSGAGDSETSVGQHLAQRLAVDFGGVRGAEQGDDLIDEAEIVAGENAEGIADDIVEAAARQVEIDVPGFLFRARLVEQAARQERRRHRIVARTAGLAATAGGAAARRGAGAGRGAAGALSSSSCSAFSIRAVSLPPGTQRLSRASALLGDRLGIVVAVIAALAAILLRHRRHHPPPQRAAFRELHAIGDRHGLVVPGRFAVVAIAGGPCMTAAPCSADSGVGHRSTAVRQRSRSARSAALRKTARSAGMISILGGGVIWFMWKPPRRQACASVSPSWRRAKVRKVSSGEARWAR